MKKNQNFLKSFACAICGIKTAIYTQRNVRFHISAAISVVICGVMLSLSAVEWMLVVLAISLVLMAELMNSAVESAVDLVTEEYHPLAKEAKDMAAGAVFLAAIGALIIGIFVFFRRERIKLLCSLLFASWQGWVLTALYIALVILFVFSRKNEPRRMKKNDERI